VSLVEVWFMPSLFCHVIVVPTDTVMLAGPNATLAILTVLG